ncbi:hypothetical protein KFL_008770010 [Klebsormidium nitens]|uniref:Uncharacterized protein n=1 Tax=Klebsormidium nitens TaxID=105231 RepID=A0A1Y1ILZ6_KLENI|nr:hypothetical protein KFL_008770010 [Klebsormidium nitens]|eukprot:GAQ91890.1 hypothetical protein KFL_008770010 [Klebsormidium nitens]
MTSQLDDGGITAPLDIPRVWRHVKQHLPWLLFLVFAVVVLADKGSSRLRKSDTHSWKASHVDTRQLVQRVLSNLQLPDTGAPSEEVGVPQPSDGVKQYWPYRPQDRTDSWAPYNYALALKRGWAGDDILQCLHKLGPHRRVTLAGDSIMRAAFRQALSERLGVDWPDMPAYWPLQQHDARWNVTDPTGTAATVTLSFRFLCNAHPHAEVALQDALDSDVLVLNSGLWDLSIPGGSDVSFVRDYMYGLAHLVAWLHANFRGRVIWRLNPSVFYQILDENRKQFFQDSKIRFVNVFAARLMRSAGYEVLDAFSMSSGDPALQGREDGYHIGHALTDTLIDLTLNQVCDPHGADFGPDTACEIIDAINADGQHNAPRWNGWGLDMSVTEDQPQRQNLTRGHGCAPPRTGT